MGDYVPFYFAPRSPMMSAITNGRVPSYGSDTSDLVHLVTAVEHLIDVGAPMLFTTRNAVLRLAEFFDDVTELDWKIDWTLMRARYWANSEEDPDRRERRMAECLVHRTVPWPAIQEVVVRDRQRRLLALEVLDNLNVDMRVRIEPDWYF